MLVNANNALGVFGSYNWREEVFDNAQGLSGETMKKTIWVKDKACFACPVRSSKFCIVKTKKDGTCLVEGPEYENIYSLGSCCGVDSIKAVALAERICDDYGMDAIEAGVAVAFAMECFEKGLLSLEETEGIDLRFGSEEVMLTMIHKIGRREGLGNLLAEGVKRTSEKIGRGSEDFAMHTKGMTFAIRRGGCPDSVSVTRPVPAGGATTTDAQRASARAWSRGTPLRGKASTRRASTI